MKTNPSSALLIRAIRDHWQTGIRIGDSVRRFIDATFGNPSPREIAAVLGDPDNEDRDVLLEVLLFPEQAFLIEIEPLLTAGCFTDRDKTAMLATLLSSHRSVTVFTGTDAPPVSIDLPDDTVRRFVERLRMTRKLPPRISDAITANLPETEGTRVRLRLRHARVPETPSGITFLKRFFDTIRYDESGYQDSLTFVVGFMEELDDGRPALTALLDKRRQLDRHLRAADAFAERLRRSNIETMMLQGERPPCVHPAEVRRTIDLIDLLIERVFGSGDIADRPHDGARDLGTVHGTSGIRSVIRQMND